MIENQAEIEGVVAEKMACSIDSCPEQASHSESATIASWRITAYFCDEHHREMEKGTPLGGLTLNNERLIVEPINPDLPAASASPALSPQ
jgi:hypothetical protein